MMIVRHRDVIRDRAQRYINASPKRCPRPHAS